MADKPLLFGANGRPNAIPAAPVAIMAQARALTVQYTDGTVRALVSGQVFAALMSKPDLRALDGVVAEDVVRGRAREAIRATDVFFEEFLAALKAKEAANKAANEAGNAPTTPEPQ